MLNTGDTIKNFFAVLNRTHEFSSDRYYKSCNMEFFKLVRVFLVAIISIIIYGCSSENQEMTFAFIGDHHYLLTDSIRSDKLILDIAEEMGALGNPPSFTVLSGDFFHGNNKANVSDEADMAFDKFKKGIHMPFFISRGNHDSRIHFERNAFPLFSEELGKKISRSYFSFDKGNCHFIMLDNLEKNPEIADSMLLWLGNDLESARANTRIKHIFAVAHDPLWIVARAGFNNAGFASKASLLLARYKIDAYLCGHTHNKTVTVRKINGQPLTQIMDAAVVEKGRLFMLAPFMKHVSPQPADISRPGILPLEEGHMIFVPESERDYYYGYQEGSTSSYYVFTVSDTAVRADWHVLGKGVVRSFMWKEPGKLTDLITPDKEDGPAVKEADLGNVSEAWLYAAPWIEKDSVKAPVMINGVKAGAIEISRKNMAASPFWNKTELPIDAKALKAITMNNEISIINPSEARFGISHLFLLVKLSDGRFAKTNIASKVLTSFDPSEGEYPSFPARELIESVKTGEPLAKMNLTFDKFY